MVCLGGVVSAGRTYRKRSCVNYFLLYFSLNSSGVEFLQEAYLLVYRSNYRQLRMDQVSYCICSQPKHYRFDFFKTETR